MDVVPEALAIIRETKIKDKGARDKGYDGIGPDAEVQNDGTMLLRVTRKGCPKAVTLTEIQRCRSPFIAEGSEGVQRPGGRKGLVCPSRRKVVVWGAAAGSELCLPRSAGAMPCRAQRNGETA